MSVIFPKKITRGALVFALTVFAATPALAWTGPTAAPPNNNVSAPLNTSSTAQTKAGYLAANGGYSGAGYPFSVGGAANTWTAIFNWPYNTTPSGSYGILAGGLYSQFENPSGYYSLLAYNNYGLYTNGYVSAPNAFGGVYEFNSTAGACQAANPLTGYCTCPTYAPNLGLGNSQVMISANYYGIFYECY